MRLPLRWLPLLAATVALFHVPGAQAAGLTLGFNDLKTIQEDPAQRPLELEHLKATRATVVRLMWEWDSIERIRPGDDASARDPAFAGYDWSALDAALRDTAAAGVTPLVTIYRAPSWWEGVPRPPVSDTARAGTWRINPQAFGRFMHAAALRYSGSYPDPDRPGQTLPRVRLWQPWNEPNLSGYLTPQWTKTKSGYAATSPGLYRPMLSAAYDEIKSASPSATVLSAGTAPYSEPKPSGTRGGTRMPPARFIRDLLCVSGRSHPRARNCRSTPAKFDILAHHPYPIGSPSRHAINPDDVAIPDFAKLKRPLAVAIKAGNVYPRTSKPIWATEMSWDTSPPDPHGIKPAVQARYAAQSMYELWRQGVDAMIWFNVRDDPKDRGYQFSLQSGVYFRGPTVAQDRPKPAVAAFRFPFVAQGPSGRKATIWGIAPAPGSVQIQIRRGSKWKALKTVRAGGDRIFHTRLKIRHGAVLRASEGGEVSIDVAVAKP